jgi:hypothetical protein
MVSTAARPKKPSAPLTIVFPSQYSHLNISSSEEPGDEPQTCLPLPSRVPREALKVLDQPDRLNNRATERPSDRATERPNNGMTRKISLEDCSPFTPSVASIPTSLLSPIPPNGSTGSCPPPRPPWYRGALGANREVSRLICALVLGYVVTLAAQAYGGHGQVD